VATMRDPAIVAGPDARVLFANNSFSDRFLLEAEEIVGRHLSAFCGLGNFSDLGAGANETVIARIADANGTTVLEAPAILRPIHHHGELMGFSLVWEDNLKTARDEGESGLGEFRRAIDRLSDGMTLWDETGRLIAANNAARARYAQYGIELHTGTDRREIIKEGIRKGFYGRKYSGMEEELFSKDWLGPNVMEPQGTRIRVEQTGHGDWIKMTSYISKHHWIMTIYEDVDDTENQHERLSNLEWYYKSILQSLGDFVVHIGNKNTIEFVNQSFAAALGKKGSEIIGQPSSIFLQDALGEPMLEHLKSVTPTNAGFSYEQRWRQADGKFVWLRWNAIALFSAEKPMGVIATGRDITVEYRQEMDLRHQSVELEKKNKSLEQFAAVVSHDLKAPLRHVSIFADMIVEEVAKENFADVASYAAHVRQASQRMDRVIRRLLEYSQVAYKIINQQRVSLADITLQAIQNLESQIEESRAEILLSKLPDFYGDAELLRHLMQNLIANAVKYRRMGARPRIKIYAGEIGSMLHLYVEDNGIGIDRKYAGTIFTAFQRLHKDEKVYDGFGIGLALCRQIVESHQGTIELDTNYRVGSRFVVKLPRHLKHLES
jgi:PAS domain S-box-containing protein